MQTFTPRPQYTNLYRPLKQRLGRSFSASLYKGLWSDRDIKATHKFSRVEGSFSGPEKVEGPVPNSVGCYKQSNSSNLHKEGGTHSVEMHALLWKILTWCHHSQITLNSQAHSRLQNSCLGCKVSNLGQWEKVALLPSPDFIAKNNLQEKVLKCVSGDYSCSNYHCRQTIQRRPDLVSGTGPEVLFRLNQRHKRLLSPSLYLL